MALRFICASVVALLGLEAAPVFAGIVASMDIVATPDGSNYDYNITLQNTGTTTIGTFWFAWIPGQNYLATPPVSVSSPTGWSEQVTNDRPTDGYGIEWTANSSASDLAAGNSLSFKFTSADTPAEVAGDSIYYPGVPVTTSFVYVQGSSGSHYEFTGPVAAVPEPSSLVLVAAVAAVGLGFAYMRRRHPLVV
jgi:hypothetical protein